MHSKSLPSDGYTADPSGSSTMDLPDVSLTPPNMPTPTLNPANASETGRRPKRKINPTHRADNLNACLCGVVVDPTLAGDVQVAVECKVAGCETRWVSLIVV